MRPQVIKIPTPASELIFFFPAQRVRWRLLSAFASLSTDATPNDRVPRLTLVSSDSAEIAVFRVITPVVASSSCSVSWAMGVDTYTSGLLHSVALPDFWFDPSWRLYLAGGYAGDVWNGITAAIQLSNE